MCGIVGIIGKNRPLTEDHYTAFVHAWTEAVERGNHASGYIAVVGHRTMFWKAPVASPAGAQALLKHLPYRKDIRLLLGHTRWATSGSPDDNTNNHPIVTGATKDLLGIHNGVITNKADVLKTHGMDSAREVDTEAAFRLIHHYGSESLKPFRMLSGLFNLAWVERDRPGRFWLVRKGNPLTMREGRDYRAFGSIASYFGGKDAMPGHDEAVPDNSWTLITSKGTKRRAFTPKMDAWERTRGRVTSSRGYYWDQRLGDWVVPDDVNRGKYWWEEEQARDEQAARGAWNVDPETGLMERRTIWPTNDE